MSEKLSLLIDVGNSSIKSAFYRHKNNGIITDSIQRFNEPQDLVQRIQVSSRVLLSNVGKHDVTDAIQKSCDNHKVPLFIAQSKSAEFGLSNAYMKPSNMGVDRWLAMLACMQRSQQKTFLVIDIGTAMTTDAVISGFHIGGWITPGLELLKSSLFNNTQRVFGDYNRMSVIEFGDDTPFCVDNGCLAQIVGTFLMAKNIMQNKVNEFDIFITGGNKNIISELHATNIIVCENLVLDGLSLFIE